MERFNLDNGVKIIYEYRPGNITSFCIGFNGGALEEEGYNPGTAHVLEHMLFKGTSSRNEVEINRAIDEIFGFSNAMTNYPYVIYYGTLNSEDFTKGFELYSDILLNPVFPEEGFKEEMMVIKEELRDWKEDLEQCTEDYMLFNAFSKRRIKNLIIGTEVALNNISLEEIKSFYKSYYAPSNCVISVVTSLNKEEVINFIESIFKDWTRDFKGIREIQYENNIPGTFINKVSGSTGARINYCFNIDFLGEEEIEILSLFNMVFGEGVSSILYDQIRTRQGFAYEVYSSIKNERGIKLFTIYLSTSLENVGNSIEIINNIIEKIKLETDYYTENIIQPSINRIRLKRELALEKSIELSKKLTTYELMYGKAEKVYDEIKFINSITPGKIKAVINKVFKDPTIQILRS